MKKQTEKPITRVECWVDGEKKEWELAPGETLLLEDGSEDIVITVFWRTTS